MAIAMMLTVGDILFGIMRAGQSMDIERYSKGKSVTMYITFLKTYDPGVRKRKQNGDSDTSTIST